MPLTKTFSPGNSPLFSNRGSSGIDVFSASGAWSDLPAGCRHCQRPCHFCFFPPTFVGGWYSLHEATLQPSLDPASEPAVPGFPPPASPPLGKAQKYTDSFPPFSPIRSALLSFGFFLFCVTSQPRPVVSPCPRAQKRFLIPDGHTPVFAQVEPTRDSSAT